MKVKGIDWSTEKHLEQAYFYFKMQIRNHHNSDPFKVKGVGEASLQNMQYLLARAKQELNVYVDKQHKHIIQLGGKQNVIHTFSLKGK